MKGKYGIGNFNSNAVIGGKGEIITTSFNGKETSQCNMDFANLSDSTVSPEDAWTGEHPYRPCWKEIENNGKYKEGVTQEFTDPTNAFFPSSQTSKNLPAEVSASYIIS